MVAAADAAYRLSRAPLLRELRDIHGRSQGSILWRFILGVCWHLIHIFVSILHHGTYLFQLLYFFLISHGILKKYQVFSLHKPQCLAIAFDGIEAEDILKIKKILQWLSNIRVKHVILYDDEGILKKYAVKLLEWKNSSIGCIDHDIHFSTSVFSQEHMSIEVLSSMDGKEAVAKAANFLYSKCQRENSLTENKAEVTFTETDIADALTAVGSGGAEPDLLLVFSPVRCHLGFPAWRMRYTEIVHMGTLKSMQYGAVVKVMYDLSKKHQNYGT